MLLEKKTQINPPKLTTIKAKYNNLYVIFSIPVFIINI